MKSTARSINILIVDDEIAYQKLFRLLLEREGHTVYTCSNGVEALAILKKHVIHLVMTDLKMPEMDGLDLIKEIRKIDDSINIFIITAYGSIDSAVEAMKVGAAGYFLKGSDSTESLLADVDRIATISTLKNDNEILRSKIEQNQMFIQSKNKNFLKMLDLCNKVARSNINILILGESGVGKEVIANYIHEMSDRSSRHLIPVNCQTFSSNLIESELFGHEKGSFTGADSRRIGRFEEANGGTLFLDEIGDLPLSSQSKLLRALESRKIERIGSNKSIDLDIRLISATNKDLDDLVARGKFREDLLYRINALTIHVLPLRERKEDIPGLAMFFFEKIKNEQKKKIKGIDEDVIEMLCQYDFPGNVRELRNIIERLVTLCSSDSITKEDMDLGFDKKQASVSNYDFMKFREAKSNFEKQYLQSALDRNHGNVAKTALEIDISRRQLWNKISEYNLTVKDRDDIF